MDNEGKKENESTCPFLLLPECVLRVLFSYLDSTTLYQLTKTCLYFQDFIMDPIFWRYMDARKNPNSNGKVQYCSERVHAKTTHIFMKAKNKTCGVVPCNFFKSINPFRNIKVLALEDQRLNGSKLTLKDFPSCLEELSLKGTHVKSSTYFFQHSAQNMQKLKVLILDQCQWVTCNFLMCVAKYECLEIISAIKCLRLHLDMIPYLSVARYGCKKLKVFDCRFTRIGHELLRTFYPKESLQSLYFQSLKSAELDYKENVFNQLYMYTEPTSRSREGENGICDESLLEYVNSSACDIIDKVPDSVLYKDPYPECKCNCRRDESRPSPLVNFDEYYIYDAPKRKSVKFVCQRHVQEVEKLSDHFREFFLRNQQQSYTDIRPGNVESEPGSSDSESEDSYYSCCMYGVSRSMILLSQGNRPGIIEEEVIQLNANEHEQGGRVVTIIIPRSMNESLMRNNANPVPSTSRSVQENSINENLENTRNESKRRHSGEDEQVEIGPSKRLKRTENLERLSDEAKAAEASELIESAGEMGRNVHKFIRNSVQLCKSRNSTQENGPTASRVQDLEIENNNATNHLRGRPENETAEAFPIEDVTSKASTSSYSSPNRTFNNVGESSRVQKSVRVEIGNRRNLVQEQVNAEPTHSRSNQNYNRADGGEPSRHNVGNNAPRTAIITIGNKKMIRYLNPLFVQIENKHVKKKSRLRRLSLRGFRKITNMALDYIKNLKLDLLDLTYTNVTKEGIENFLAYNPNCRIIHPLYCICKPLNPF